MMKNIAKQFSSKTYLFLILVVILGGVFRFWRLSDLPYPPNLDELSFGYYGWSILHFGTDEYGNKFPLYFPSIGDFKYPVLAYLNIIPALFFGLTDFAVRFWSALSGTLLIIIVFLLGRKLFLSEFIGLVAAFILAVTPWGITLSRLGYETNVAVSITSLGILLLMYSSSFKNRKWLIMSTFCCFLLSMFCYSAQRIFIPLFLLGLGGVFYYFKQKFVLSHKTFLLFGFALLFIGFISFIPWESRGRASSVATTELSPEQQTMLVDTYIEAGTSPVRIHPRITYLFHNQYSIKALSIFREYTSYFSPDYLFFTGDRGPEKIPLVGEFLHILILFLPLGLFAAFFEKKYRAGGILLLFWLLSAPVAASLTEGGPFNTRSSMMIVPLTLFIGLGFIWAFEKISILKYKYLFAVLTLLLVSLNTLFFANQLFVQKPVARPWVSEQGNKEMVQFVYAIKDNYKAVVIPDNEYIFFLFYNQISPKEFLATSQIDTFEKMDHWKKVNRFSNIYFKMPFECPRSGKLNVLYVCNGVNIPQNAKVIKVFRFLDTVPHFSLIEFYPISKMEQQLSELPSGLDYMVDIETNPEFPDGIIPDGYHSLW
jgi:4-amino-4-deoxy-L-arabinose transferase-like glycosyltransferase